MKISLLVRSLGLMVLAGSAMAQTGQRTPAPAATADAPERTTAVFGDWSVQCITRNPGGKLCEMVQATQNQQQQPISVLAIGRLNRSEPLRLVARLPVTALVAEPVRLTMEGDAGFALPFRYCNANPVGCFAEITLSDDAQRRLRGRNPEQQGKLEFKDPAGQAITIPVSFRGFGAALEALLKEAV